MAKSSNVFFYFSFNPLAPYDAYLHHKNAFLKVEISHTDNYKKLNKQIEGIFFSLLLFFEQKLFQCNPVPSQPKKDSYDVYLHLKKIVFCVETLSN